MPETDRHGPGRIGALVDPIGSETRISASLSGSGLRLGIVCARFNSTVTTRLFEGARAQAERREADPRDIVTCFVPGAFELPLAAQELARSGRVDAVVCLGAVVRGETSHYELVANAAAEGCLEVQLATGVPVAFGVLTTENLPQALARSGGEQGHKGEEAVDVAIEMARLSEAIGKEASGTGVGIARGEQAR